MVPVFRRQMLRLRAVSAAPYRASSSSPPTGGREKGEGGKSGLFPVRMLRWVSVSPDGKNVAYTALGHIYVRPLPAGAPRRLTKQTDHFEYYPSWSRDSKSLVYTSWNDEKLGEVRVARTYWLA